MGFETQDVERKTLAILRVLADAREVVGSRIIAQRLKDLGIKLGERAVRYHLKLTDERGFTELVGRDGRLITKSGLEELKNALVRDKVGFIFSRIELLTFRTDFDLDRKNGLVPVNISIFTDKSFHKALHIMRPVFKASLCVSDLVSVARDGETIGEFIVPEGKVAFATVCSIVVNGSLLKAGIPMDSRFGGILEMRNHQPLRFVELIHYSGSSLDPSEAFIMAKMTSAIEAARTGYGKILANFREIPSLCRPLAEDVIGKLRAVGMNGVLVMGNTSEPVCEVPVELNRVGVILLGGLNPVSAAAEAGFVVENPAMSTLVDYKNLTRFEALA